MPGLHAANPFALLMTPEVVLQAVRASSRLEQLNSRVCRPLDKLQPGSTAAADAALDDADDDATAPRVND